MTSRRYLVICSLASLLGLASCVTQSAITLDYVPPPGGTQRGAPEFNVGAFANKRGMNSMELGTIKLPLGVPIETLQSTSPVETVVANAFAHALELRGMLTDSSKARYLVTGEVQALQAELLVHPYAYAKVRLNIVEMGSGRVLFSKIYSGERQSTAYRPGSGSPVPLLRELTSRALQDAVDRAIDDPAMRAQLRSAPTGGYRPGFL